MRKRFWMQLLIPLCLTVCLSARADTGAWIGYGWTLHWYNNGAQSANGFARVRCTDTESVFWAASPGSTVFMNSAGPRYDLSGCAPRTLDAETQPFFTAVIENSANAVVAGLVLGTHDFGRQTLRLIDSTLSVTEALTLNAHGFLELHRSVFNGGRLAGPGELAMTNSILNLAGGTIPQRATFEGTNIINVTGGELTGPVTIPTNVFLNFVGSARKGISGAITNFGTITFTGTGDHDMPGVLLVNHGTVIWNGGRIRGGGTGTTIENFGVWDAQAASEMNGEYGGNGVTFRNHNLVLKSAGGNTVIQSGVFFVNSGTVTIQTNALVYNNGGLFLDGSRFTGAGESRLAAGVFTLDGAIQSENLTQTGGTLSGTNVLRGVYTWLSGNWNSPGFTTIPEGATLRIDSSADHDLAGHALTNRGTVLWRGGRVRGGGTGGTRIHNLGMWNAQTHFEINAEYGGNGMTFQNDRLFLKSDGTNTVIRSGVLFINNDTVEVNTNALVFANGGLFQEGAKFIGTGENRLSDGTFTMNGRIVSSNLVQVGGTLAGTNSFSGVYIWASGDWNSAGRTTIETDGTLRVESGAEHNLAGHTFINKGTVIWRGGLIRGGGAGSLIQNEGLWDIQVDAEFNAAFGGNGMRFENAGVLRKSGGAGNTFIRGGVVFTNSGETRVQQGAIRIQGGGSSTGGIVTTGGIFDIASAFTLSAGNSFTGDGILFSAGSLTGTWTGSLNWTGGQLAQTTLIPTNGVLVITGSGDHDLPGCVLTNWGTVIWADGKVRGGGIGSRIVNLGTWDVRTQNEMNAAFGGNGLVFLNQQLFLKSAGTNTALQSGVLFINAAQLRVETNALVFNDGGLFLDGSTFVGAGENRLASGTFTMDGTILSSNLVQVGGTLTGTNILAGVYTWLSGNWNSAASTTVATNALLKIQGSADHDLSSHTLTNLGTVLWSGGRIRGGGSGSTIQNLGLWDIQTASEINSNFGGNGLAFRNKARLVKSTGANTAIQDGVSFINAAGTVEVLTNALVFNGGCRFEAGSQFIGAGETRLAGGTFVLEGTITSSNIVQVGGTLAGDHEIVGLYVWSAGNWNSRNTTSIRGDSVLRIQSGADHDMPNHALLNNGTVIWAGGRIRGGGSASWPAATFISNSGLFDAQVDSEINNDFGGNGVQFDNQPAGRFRKSGGTGMLAFRGATGFSNRGTIEAQTGVIALPAAVNQASSVYHFTLNSDTDFGRISSAVAARLAGTLRVSLAPGYSPTVGTAFNLITYPSVTGQFDTINLPAGWEWEAKTNATAYTLTVLRSLTNQAPVIISMERPVKSTNQVQLNFTLTSGTASSFKLLTATNVAGPYVLDESAVFTNNPQPNSFRFTTTATNSFQFFRVQTP